MSGSWVLVAHFVLPTANPRKRRSQKLYDQLYKSIVVVRRRRGPLWMEATCMKPSAQDGSYLYEALGSAEVMITKLRQFQPFTSVTC